MVYVLRIQRLYTLDVPTLLLKNRKISKFAENIPLIHSHSSFHTWWCKFRTYLVVDSFIADKRIYCHDKYIFETDESLEMLSEDRFRLRCLCIVLYCKRTASVLL